MAYLPCGTRDRQQRLGSYSTARPGHCFQPPLTPGKGQLRVVTTPNICPAASHEGESPGFPQHFLTVRPGQRDMSRFANCSGFNESQIVTLAALRGGTSAVAAAATVVLLVVTCACQSRLEEREKWLKKYLKKYLFILFGVSISYLTVLCLGVVYHFLPASNAEKWCEAFGLFDQSLSVIQITLLFIIIMVVFGSYRQEENELRKKIKKWVLRGSIGFVSVLAVVIVISGFVPLITGTYGAVGGWCWIVDIKEDCENLFVGLMEQIFLWIIYHALISLICILIVLRAVALFVRACICACKRGNYEDLDGRHNLPYLFSKYIFQLIILVPIFIDFVDFVLVGHIHNYNFTLWVLFATAPPISGFLIPFSFLLYIRFGNTESRNALLHEQNNAREREWNRNDEHPGPSSTLDQHPGADLRGGNEEQNAVLMEGIQVEQSSYAVIGDIDSKYTTTSSGFETAKEIQSGATTSNGYETAEDWQSGDEECNSSTEARDMPC